jgi:hypothetical protein
MKNRAIARLDGEFASCDFSFAGAQRRGTPVTASRTLSAKGAGTLESVETLWLDRLIEYDGDMDQVLRKRAKGLFDWAEGKPLALVCTAWLAASQAESIYQMLRQLRDGEWRTEHGAVCSVDRWLMLYRRTRWLHDLGWELMSGHDDPDVRGSDVVGALREFARTPKEETIEELEKLSPEELREAWQVGQEFGQAMIEESLRVAVEEADEVEPTEDELQELEEFRRNELTHYFALVWFPCWMLYGEQPSRLLRYARNGDLEALEKLLRVDKSVIADSRIREIFHEAAYAPNQRVFRRLVGALGRWPDGQLTRGRVKKRLAGLVSLIFKAAGKQISEPEVRDLMDRIAQLQGKRIDTDIPDSPEAFAKALQRERTAWQNVIPRAGQK